MWQGKFFSQVWVLLCTFRSLVVPKAFAQISQKCSLILSWTSLMWFFNITLDVKDFPHWEQKFPESLATSIFTSFSEMLSPASISWGICKNDFLWKKVGSDWIRLLKLLAILKNVYKSSCLIWVVGGLGLMISEINCLLPLQFVTILLLNPCWQTFDGRFSPSIWACIKIKTVELMRDNF